MHLYLQEKTEGSRATPLRFFLQKETKKTKFRLQWDGLVLFVPSQRTWKTNCHEKAQRSTKTADNLSAFSCLFVAISDIPPAQFFTRYIPANRAWRFCNKTSVLLALLLSSVSFAAAPIEIVLEPVRSMVVSAPVDGVIESVVVDEGDRVETGDSLVTFVRSQEDLRVERAREVLRKRQFDAEGTAQLFADNMTSETEKLEKEIERRVAEIDLAEAIDQRDRRLVTAVHDGVVTLRHHEAGEYVERGEPLLALVDQGQLDARFYVRPHEGLELAVGDSVWIHVPLVDETLRCLIVFVDPLVDPSSGLMRARVRVDNTTGRFKPGLRGWVSLTEEEPATWP